MFSREEPPEQFGSPHSGKFNINDIDPHFQIDP
jgi:hypothetical protein